MKRVFVDYTWLGTPEKVRQFRARLCGSERDGMRSGLPVIVEGDSVPDRTAYFIEFIDDHLALFSFEPPTSAGTATEAT